MAVASAVLMFAGSPQSFMGAASALDTLFLLLDVVTVYGRHFSGEVARTLAGFREIGLRVHVLGVVVKAISFFRPVSAAHQATA